MIFGLNLILKNEVLFSFIFTSRWVDEQNFEHEQKVLTLRPKKNRNFCSCQPKTHKTVIRKHGPEKF